jgi:UDP-glucose 4-epimerase
MQMSKKALILGSNGYLGSHFCWLILKAGYQINAADIQEKSFIKEIEYKQVDITNKEDIQKLDWDVDFVFVFSGMTGTSASIANYEKFVSINELGLLHILDSISKSNHSPKLVFPSTRLVYKGKENTPLKESDELEAKTVYAANKIACEKYIEMFSNYSSINYNIFRIGVPYGNLIDHGLSYGTISFMLNKAKSGETITLFGDGELKRTYTHIEDIFNQIIEIIDKDSVSNQIFNINGETLSLNDVANEIDKLYHCGISYIEFPEEALKLESGDTIFDGSKINSIVTTEQKHHFKEWIANH